MLCMSPSLRQSRLNSSRLSSVAHQLCYGFVMDGVKSVHNLSRPAAGGRMFHVYADPHFRRFDDGIKRFFFLPNEYLTINVSVGDWSGSSMQSCLALLPTLCSCSSDIFPRRFWSYFLLASRPPWTKRTLDYFKAQNLPEISSSVHSYQTLLLLYTVHVEPLSKRYNKLLEPRTLHLIYDFLVSYDVVVLSFLFTTNVPLNCII